MVQKLSAVRVAFHRSRDVQIVLFDMVVSVSCFLHKAKIICFLFIPSGEVVDELFWKGNESKQDNNENSLQCEFVEPILLSDCPAQAVKTSSLSQEVNTTSRN